MDRISKFFRHSQARKPIPDQTSPFSIERVKYRQASQSDLLALEWDGEYAHFRRLYAEAYRYVELGQAVIWLAELINVSLVGQLLVHLKSDRSELADGRSRAYIYGFRIKPIYQNKGVGTRLLRVAEDDLVQRGYQIVNLNVGQDNNRACQLYERLGYRVVGTDPGRWSYFDQLGRRQDVNEPAWRMQKRL